MQNLQYFHKIHKRSIENKKLCNMYCLSYEWILQPQQGREILVVFVKCQPSVLKNDSF